MKTLIAIILTIALYFTWSNIKDPIAAPEITADVSNAEVVLYATSWCGYCKRTREFLNTNNVPFKEYDVEKSQKGSRDFKELNGKGVPLMIVNGTVIRGYNPQGLIHALNGT